MTLCIAAAARSEDKPCLILCADHKIGTLAAQAEIGFKFKWVRNGWPALIAGDLSRAEELVTTFKEHLVMMNFDEVNVFDAMKSAGETFRVKLVNELVQKKLSISYEDLQKNRAKFPPATVYEIYGQIGQVDSEAELIAAGFLDGKSYIFVVERDCTVSFREHFAAIGTGATIAEPALFQRGQHKWDSVVDTVYQVYEAKRLGEIADGVGKRTTEVIITPMGDETHGNVRIERMTDKGLEFLEGKYKELGLKPVPSLSFEDGFLSED